MNKSSIENIPEITIKIHRFNIHNKEVYLFILEENKYLLDEFFDDLSQFKPFEESRKKLIQGLIKKMNISTPLFSNDNYILDNLIGNSEAFNSIEELHITYLRDSKIGNIIN